MTVAHTELTLHYTAGLTPLLDIYRGSPIRFDPKPHESFFGIVLSKTVTSYPYPSFPNFSVPRQAHALWSPYVKHTVIFHLLLQVPPHMPLSPHSPEYHAHLTLMPGPVTMYPTIRDFYNSPARRTLLGLRLWLEGWKWWYLSRGVTLTQAEVI